MAVGRHRAMVICFNFALRNIMLINLIKNVFTPCAEGEGDSYHKSNKAKRVRTTFTEEQLQILQANFQIDSNPDGQDLERIASVTGLSKRVTQVW